MLLERNTCEGHVGENGGASLAPLVMGNFWKDWR